MLKSPTLRKRTSRTKKRVAMKQTTKPNTSRLLKRDLVGNVAALPLPTPPAGARGEGRWFAEAKSETRNSKCERSSKTRIQKTSHFEIAGDLVDLQFPRFTGIAVRRDEPLSLSFVNTNPKPTTDFRLPNV